MEKTLTSVCFGNWRGYKGTREELQAMFDICKEECKDNKSSLADLLYCEKHISEMKPSEDGLYYVDYWSKW